MQFLNRNRFSNYAERMLKIFMQRLQTRQCDWSSSQQFPYMAHFKLLHEQTTGT